MITVRRALGQKVKNQRRLTRQTHPHAVFLQRPDVGIELKGAKRNYSGLLRGESMPGPRSAGVKSSTGERMRTASSIGLFPVD